jgi:hypothetical protein
LASSASVCGTLVARSYSKCAGTCIPVLPAPPLGGFPIRSM